MKILNITGTPFAETKKIPVFEVDQALHQYAICNRMHLFFLESLNRHNFTKFTGEYRKLVERYERVNGTIITVAETLEKNGIDYAYFKTIRPYREVTVDLDLIFFNDRQKATRILKDADFRLLEVGPLSTTLRDEKSKINIDLYGEIGVSHIIYMDKKKTLPFIVKKTIKDEYSVKSLDAVADLLAIISHSIIKEQLYVLSEYFTAIHYLNQMNSQELNNLVETAEQWKLKKALSTHLSITALLHMKAHGFIPKPLKKLLETVNYDSGETQSIRERDYKTPHKYRSATLFSSLLEKLSEPTAQRSFATQLVKMFNPTFASRFMKETLRHITRKEY